MRSISLLLLAAAVAGCSTAPAQQSNAARSQAEFQRLTSTRVAGAPIRCIPSLSARQAQIVAADSGRVAFRDGVGSTVYVSQLRGGTCQQLNSSMYTLVTAGGGTFGLCSGEPARVVDLHNGVTVDSCVLGDFTPYRRR